MNQYVCVPITESRAADFTAALREADRVAEAIELRLDYLEVTELPELLDWLAREGATLAAALVLTFRPSEQGGAARGDAGGAA